MASSETVAVSFPERGSEYGRVVSKLEQFVSNNHIPEFRPEERASLKSNIEALSEKGVRGFVHVVHRGSPTGESVMNSLPKEVRAGYYEQLHVVSPKDVDSVKSDPRYRDYISQHPENFIVVGDDGGLSAEARQRLDEIFTNRAGILLGGGPGSATDAVYQPIIDALEKPIESGTPILGICLGHQEIGEYLKQKRGEGQGVYTRGYNLGPESETITPEGKKHNVFGRMGDAVTAVHVHHDHWDLGVNPDYARILSVDQAGAASALAVDLAYPGQALTWQAHPEFPMAGEGNDFSAQDESFKLRGTQVTIPKGTHKAYASLLKNFVGSSTQFESLHSKYDITVNDVVDMTNPMRLTPNVGERFYGPALLWMSDFRKKHLPK